MKKVNQDDFAMNPEEGYQTAHFVIDEMLGFFSETRSMTAPQAKIALFMVLSYHTTLLPQPYRFKIVLEGPPGSGKTRIMFEVGKLFAVLPERQDSTTSAVMKRVNDMDCRIILSDEEKKPENMNDTIMMQTIMSSGMLFSTNTF